MSEEKSPVRRIGIHQARRRLGPMVDDVAAGNGPIEITRRGKVLAVLGDPAAVSAMNRLGVRPRVKNIHMAKMVNGQGGVSAACFKRPRAINLAVASWTNRADAVTCRKCLARMAEKEAGRGVR